MALECRGSETRCNTRVFRNVDIGETSLWHSHTDVCNPREWEQIQQCARRIEVKSSKTTEVLIWVQMM